MTYVWDSDARRNFYQNYRKHFTNYLSQSQVNGYESIFDAFYKYTMDQILPPAPFNRRDVVISQLAYILATVYHETGTLIEPVREGFKKTDQEARDHVAWMYRRGLISRNYAAPDPVTGESYYGRGYVQLTHKSNYLRAGEMLGFGDNFVWNPDLVMMPKIAAEILVFGMAKGIFTGRQLWEYINSNEKNYYRARKVVNGLDRASIIAEYAARFERCLIRIQRRESWKHL